MNYMFGQAISFNIPIGDWDAHDHDDEWHVLWFYFVINLIRNWDVSAVEELAYMFSSFFLQSGHPELKRSGLRT